MKRVSTIAGATTALILLAALAACSPPAEKAETAAPVASAPAAPAVTAEAKEEEADEDDVPVPLDVKDAAGTQLSGNLENGERVFRQCASCHVVTDGVNRVGPSLHAIIGRTAGTVAGFKYSDANKNSGVTWTEQELYTYLENPRAKIPGTTMAFVGLRDSQQRADVIAYLKEKTK
ncbi:MAG: cytochrome c family protein [Hyphomonadaceae bacterium]|nr:MAG: cytochrome c [Caulobacteraceae bacterium]MBT9446996.1 cytochrome c family protein [Hyphomonadaceae bacterium]TPW01639.1 MAG: cytochrome c [Alphaproteobacteria bacterium]